MLCYVMLIVSYTCNTSKVDLPFSLIIMKFYLKTLHTWSKGFRKRVKQVISRAQLVKVKIFYYFDKDQ